MNDTHPGDDALSASLDGEATSEEVAHIASCASCRARADRLRRAADAVGQPIPAVSDADRDSAVLTTLRGASATAPVSIASRRPRVPAWVMGAAAAVLAVAVLVPVLGRTGDGADESENASSAAGASTTSVDASASAPLSAPVPAPVDAGDLGAIDVEDVEAQVTTELVDRGAAQKSGTGADPGSSSEAASDEAAPECRNELVGAEPTVGALRLTATASADGRPVRILAFDAARDDGPYLLVFVVSVDDCGDVLRSVTYPAP